MKILEWIKEKFKDKPYRPEDEVCPVCGYYCTGSGKLGCIDKPKLIKLKDSYVR